MYVMLDWIDSADAVVMYLIASSICSRSVHRLGDSVTSNSALNDEGKNVVSAETPDWSRERKGIFEWAPSRALIASIRAYQRYASSRGWWAGVWRAVAVLRHRWWSVVTGADIPLNCRLGGGLLMPHPNGIVIHPAADIGPNCLLFQQVTIGGGDRGAP